MINKHNSDTKIYLHVAFQTIDDWKLMEVLQVSAADSDGASLAYSSPEQISRGRKVGCVWLCFRTRTLVLLYSWSQLGHWAWPALTHSSLFTYLCHRGTHAASTRPGTVPMPPSCHQLLLLQSVLHWFLPPHLQTCPDCIKSSTPL